MASAMTPGSKFHVLLIGIDRYIGPRLRGCVNDIDAVQRLLRQRIKLPKECIRRLASPHPETSHDTEIPADPATLANLRAALAELGSEKVSAGDRVLIYYSGHGVRIGWKNAAGHVFHRESLVPVDFNIVPDKLQLLFDLELNRYLAAISERTRSVAVILDCCHAAGATRDLGDELRREDLVARCLDLGGRLVPADQLADPAGGESTPGHATRGFAQGVDACQVVSACLDHEAARESSGSNGVRQGVLTRAFTDALKTVADADLLTVPWGRIWQAMCASVEMTNPLQHLSMAGSAARAVLAGPPVDGDAGLGVTRTADGAYQIDAGTLAGITRGARIAIYGPKPATFPPLGSDEDRKKRGATLLEVISAERATATARADGEPFELLPGARGRLVAAGDDVRLRCAVVPADKPLAARLAPSPLLELVDSHRAQVRLERRADHWAVTDDVHGVRGSPALFTFGLGDIACARPVLEHYYRYALPLRMANLATDLRGQLQLAVLAYPNDRELEPAEVQEANLPEATTVAANTYDLVAGARVCFRVCNASDRQLLVTLVNSAASGKVQFLGEQSIDPHSFHVFWASNHLGKPFTMTPPAGATRCIDRLTAIGRTALDRTLAFLRSDKNFADIIRRSRGSKNIDDGTPPSDSPVEQWTATQAILKTRQR